MTQYSVMIVEDNDEVKNRLAQLVGECERLELVAAVGTLEKGKATLLTCKPDILLTDIGLPDGSGVELIKAIHEHHLDCEAMVISGFQDEHIVFDALEAGAKSYILKHNQGQQISDAIFSMINGGAPMSPVIARLMLKKFQRQVDANIKLPEALTERQMKILKFISQGFSSKEIAEKLDISYYTVTTHIKHIYGKLQVNSRTEATHEATRLGLL